MTNLLDLIKAGLIEAGTELRPMTSSFRIKALITGEGRIEFAQQFFDDPETAMNTAMLEYPDQQLRPLFQANGWQFWSYYNQQRQAWAPLEHLRAALELLATTKEAEIEGFSQQNQNQEAYARTSDSHPLRIDTLVYPKSDTTSGLVGLTFCPGKITQGLYGGYWQRDLDKDIQIIQQWQTDTVITLMEAHEFEELGVPQFVQVMNSQPFEWLHLPIPDMNPPSSDFKDAWMKAGPTIHQKLQRGKRILLHCRGGLGRTGLLAAQILIESGMLATQAIQRVRAARDRTIETFGQEEYLLKL